MKRITFLLLFLSTISSLFAQEIPDLSEGVFILNEGQFGTDPGSLNFIDSDYTFHQNVYQTVNDSRFGNTSSFATIYADKLFVVSKQANASEGGRLVVANAETLEELANIDELGGDGRSFVGVNPHKAYIGTSNGIYSFDLDEMSVGEQVVSTESNQQIGNMLRTSQYVFAVQQGEGIVVLDPETDSSIATILGDFSSIALAKDGSVWAIGDETLYQIDPLTFEKESYDIPTTTYLAPWPAWNAGSFTASIADNVLYWIEGGSFSVGQKIVKFDIDTETFDEDFAITPGDGNQEGYGAALRINPANNQIVLSSVGANFSYSENWIDYLNADGEVIETIQPDDYYWFPSIPFFPDNAVPTIDESLVSQLSLAEDDEVVIDLKDKVSDVDNNSAAIVKSISELSEEGIVNAEINVNDELVITYIADGHTTLSLQFDSNGKTITHDIEIYTGEEAPADFGPEDVVYYVGEGNQTAYFVVDFRDETADASFTWGVHFNEGEDFTALDALEVIQEEDAHFEFNQTGGFLNDIYYNDHQGIAGDPDWWSTWDGNSISEMELNMGVSRILTDGLWFGLSYGFIPEPEQPRFIYAAYNEDWLQFEDIEEWFGEGENQTLISLDFVSDETAEEVTFAFGLQFENETITGKEALETLANLDSDLEVVFNDADEIIEITYNGLNRSANSSEKWKAFKGTSMADYAPSEATISLTNGDFFGVSFGDEKVRRPFIPEIINNPGMGVAEVGQHKVKVWPNPTADELHIETTAQVQELRVFDIQGRVIFNRQDTTLDVRTLSSGNYLLQIVTDEGTETKQFIKQ